MPLHPLRYCRQVIVDTNFINFSIRNKIDLVQVSRGRDLAPLSVLAHTLPPCPCLRPTSPPPGCQGMLDCLYAQCTPMITDCVMAELEKLGQKYRVVRGEHGRAGLWRPTGASPQ